MDHRGCLLSFPLLDFSTSNEHTLLLVDPNAIWNRFKRIHDIITFSVKTINVFSAALNAYCYQFSFPAAAIAVPFSVTFIVPAKKDITKQETKKQTVQKSETDNEDIFKLTLCPSFGLQHIEAHCERCSYTFSSFSAKADGIGYLFECSPENCHFKQ